MEKLHKPLLSAEEALRKYWGYDTFRSKQRDIIDSILAGHDTLALLPTGGGKSITYQIPALLLPGVCIVVTPLIALMKDQVDQLRQRGIPAVAIHSGLSRRQIDIAYDNCTYGDIKILFISPERATSPNFIIRMDRMTVSLLAIDEAHCISQWGYDFRPSYLKIGLIRELIPGVPVLALTASATELVCNDIMQRLKFRSERIIRGSFARPNLSYAIRATNDKNSMLLRILSSVDGSAIVYVRSRKGAEQISQFLTTEGVAATFYHGGLPHTERSLRQDEWLSGEYRVIVATNAFGMGIDKPDVRVVIHYTMCNSLEAYYQEAGRGGRDGQRSYAVLMISPDDIARVERSVESEFPSLELVKSIYDKICTKLEIPYGEGEDISYNFNTREFCRDERIFSTTIQSALKLLQMNGYMTFVDEMTHPARIMFMVNRDDLYRVRVLHEDLDSFIRVLLRLYDGVFTDFRAIEESHIAMVSGYTVSRVKELLKRLWQMRLIRYTPTNYSSMIYLNESRLPISDLFISPESYKYRKDLYSERLNSMVEYAQNEQECRSRVLERYFGGELESPDCGVCDVCLANRRRVREVDSNPISLRTKILAIIGDKDEPATTIKWVATSMRMAPERLVAEVDAMLAEGILEIDSAGRLRQTGRK